jgi:hypothetical protein
MIRPVLAAAVVAALLRAAASAAPAADVPEPEEVRVRVARAVDGARTLALAQVARPAPDPRFLPLARLLARASAIGKPVLQRVGREPACWRVDLLDAGARAGTLHARLDGLAVIEWPHRTVHRDDSPDLIPARTFSILDTFPPDTVPTLAFYAPPPSAVMPPVMFDGIELGRIVKLVGLPIRTGDRIEGRIPHVSERWFAKRLKESRAWVARVNRRRPPVPVPWTTVSGPRSVSAKCWSYAFSFALDWWARELGFRPGTYVSTLTGERERGHDPRALEVLYRSRAEREPDRFLFVPSVFMQDPVTGEPIPSNMDAFASAVASREGVTLPEPLIPDLTARARSTGGPRWPMEGWSRRVFHLNQADHQAVVRALHRHGVVIAGEVHRYRGSPLYYSTHAVPIVGHVGIAGAPYLVYLDPLLAGRSGDGAAAAAAAAAPRLRAYPASMFAEAYCFPHTARVSARVRAGPAGALSVVATVTNGTGGRLAGADSVTITGSSGAAVPMGPVAGARYSARLEAGDLARLGRRVTVRALVPAYYGPDETGASVELELPRAGGVPR